MTVTGEVFKSYAEAIVKAHGFGSKKMVLDWSTDFLKGVNETIREAGKGTPEQDVALEMWEKCYDGQEFLLKNEYIRTYRPEWTGWKGRKPVRRRGSLYVGLTEKGWAVAHLYLNEGGENNG